MSGEATALLEALRDEGARLSRMSLATLPTAVPSCPGWSGADVLVHLGRVHRWTLSALSLPTGAEWPAFPPRPGAETELVGWVTEGVERLAEQFATDDLDRPCWGFAGDATVGWWLRRQTFETLVHRWDLDAAAGSAEPIDGEVAALGLDEWCELEAARWFSARADLAATVHLHATDGPGEWLVAVDADGFRWSHGHHKGDIAVRATRSELYLLAWNRIDAEALEVFGDRRLLAQVLAAAAVG